MIHVIASITVKEPHRAEFLEIFKANIENVRREQGCIEYRPTVDVETDIGPQVVDERVVTVIEKWDTLEDLLAHLGAPHMAAYRERVSGIVAAVSLKVLEDA